MDLSNPVIQLCMQGTQAEYARKPEQAASLYKQAWDIASSPYECCVAAHYVARFQPSPAKTLRWNETALRQAELADPAEIKEFLPSLYLNLGQSYQDTGNLAESVRYFKLAADLGAVHSPGINQRKDFPTG